MGQCEVWVQAESEEIAGWFWFFKVLNGAIVF